jgi:hypothetical protein
MFGQVTRHDRIPLLRLGRAYTYRRVELSSRAVNWRFMQRSSLISLVIYICTRQIRLCRSAGQTTDVEDSPGPQD